MGKFSVNIVRNVTHFIGQQAMCFQQWRKLERLAIRLAQHEQDATLPNKTHKTDIFTFL
jgi:hypothetical protein